MHCARCVSCSHFRWYAYNMLYANQCSSLHDYVAQRMLSLCSARRPFCGGQQQTYVTCTHECLPPHLLPAALGLQSGNALLRSLRAGGRDVLSRGGLQLRARGRQRRIRCFRLRIARSTDFIGFAMKAGEPSADRKCCQVRASAAALSLMRKVQHRRSSHSIDTEVQKGDADFSCFHTPQECMLLKATCASRQYYAVSASHAAISW